MTRDELEQWLRDQRFSRAAELARIAERCWLATAGESSGRSRFGGVPDLASGQPWPTSPDGRRLAFLAQIDLADLGPPFPNRGLASFYFDAESTGPPTGAMTFAEEPTTSSSTLPGMTFHASWSFPRTGVDAIFPLHFGLDEAASRELMEASEAWAIELDRHGAGPRMQLGGYADGENDPYVGTALDADEALRARFFAMSVRERTKATPADVVAAALAFRHFATFEALPDIDGFADGASLRFLVHRDVWTSASLVVDPTTKRVPVHVAI